MLMRFILVTIVVCTSFCINAQPKKAVRSETAALLNEIEKFEENIRKKDSAALTPLTSFSEKDKLNEYKFYKGIKAKIDKIDKKSVSFSDHITLELLRHSLGNEISGYEYKTYLNPLLSDNGYHSNIAFYARNVFRTKKEFAEYMVKLRDVPRYIEQGIQHMRKGLSLGISQPAVIMKNYESTYNTFITDDPEKSLFWSPFTRKAVDVNDEEWQAILQEGRKAIMESVVKGYRDFKNFFEKEYLPKARTTIGVSHFPNGLAYYQDRANHFTTTEMPYEEIYQLGLTEVARIKAEMMKIMEEVKFNGSLQEFITSLRNDPKSYPSTELQLLKEASFIAKKIDGKLPLLFKKLPRQPYGVEEVPADLAPNYTGGRYSGAPIEGTRAGFYWVNTYNLSSRTLYTLEALTLHEAMPGHHLQIALAQELEGLSKFRKEYYISAFGEGWGLYAEHLGTELGLYQDPYSRFGKLTYEMWRACRLVLDVALHTKGWTRDQAVNYLAENTALSLHEVNTEINRYISWPGQALAYKIGELKIKELRKRAEEKLKEKFDVREFHDVVLSEGSVTLKILEEMIDRYIEDKLRK